MFHSADYSAIDSVIYSETGAPAMFTRERRDLIVRVARLRHLNGLTQSRIGQKLQPEKKQSAVAKLLDDAEKYGVVRYGIDAEAIITGEQELELSDDLRKAFALDSAYAVDFAPDLTGDELPVGLANFAADKIRNTLRSNDHIAVAGGRTVARFCRAITNKPVNVHHVVITPLGGRLWSGHLWKAPTREGKHFEQPLNPDDCGLILAQGLHGGFQPEITFSQVSHPLFANSEAEAKTIIRENCAFRPGSGWNWNLPAPSQAFVGVGMVSNATHHRLAEWLASNEKAPARATLEDLAEAGKRAKELGLPEFGDVANRLFVSLPLPSALPRLAPERAALLKEVRKLDTTLLRINRRSVVMDWDHLRDIDLVFAMAGGTATSPKLEALWTILLGTGLYTKEERFRLLTAVATDSATAIRLVEEREKLRALDPDVTQWYKAALEFLFPKQAKSGKKRGPHSP